MKDDSLTAIISRRADQTRSALDGLAGVKWTSSHEAMMKAGSRQAHATLLADDSISFRLPTPLPDTPSQALSITTTLPGNVRFALLAGGPGLAADTRLDGHAHLADSFGEVRDGLLLALGKKPKDELAPQAATPELVARAVDQLDWPEEAIVEHEGSWELRPNVEGRAVAVQLTLAAGHIDLRRSVLAIGPGDEAALWQALRYNACIRHARLAVRDTNLVVEAQLHGGQASGSWLGFAARAVACASRHVEASLRLLAQDAAVAAMYLRVFPVAQSPGPAAAPAE
jgi:hypothetical protein